ncbi:MAG: hypothetical protein V4451_05870 [Pseudomonadota bacterium]
MKSALQTIGAVVVVFYALGWLGFVDFSLCVGKPGACNARPAAKPQVTV